MSVTMWIPGIGDVTTFDGALVPPGGRLISSTPSPSNKTGSTTPQSESTYRPVIMPPAKLTNPGPSKDETGTLGMVTAPLPYGGIAIQSNLDTLLFQTKVNWWNAKANFSFGAMQALESQANALRMQGARETNQTIQMDRMNTIVYENKKLYYRALADRDFSKQADLQQAIRNARMQGATISDNTLLDNINLQIFESKINKWNAVARGDLDGVTKAFMMENSIRRSLPMDLNALIPAEGTGMNIANGMLINRRDAFQEAVLSNKFQDAANQLIQISNLAGKGTLNDMSPRRLTQTQLDSSLYEIKKLWWSARVSLDSIETQNDFKKAMTVLQGSVGNGGMGARESNFTSNLDNQNQIMLAAKRDFWNSAMSMDMIGTRSASDAMQRAAANGATIAAGLTTGLDAANRSMMNNKIQWWQDYNDKGLSSTGKQLAFEQEISKVRNQAKSAGMEPYVISNDNTVPSTTNPYNNINQISSHHSGAIDNSLKNLYLAKKDKWKAIETMESNYATQKDVEMASVTRNNAQNRETQIRSQLNSLFNQVKIFVPDEWNIDLQNNKVLSGKLAIEDSIARGDFSSAQTLLENTKKLLSEGATIEIDNMISIPQNLPGNALMASSMFNPIKQTGTISWSKPLYLAKGFGASILESAKEMPLLLPTNPAFYTETLPAAWEFGKALYNRDITLKDIKSAVSDELIYPFEHVINNFNHVFNEDPTKEEAYDYGYYSGKAIQNLAGAATLGEGLAVKLSSKAPKLMKLLSRVREAEGTGNLEEVIEKSKKIITFINPADPFRDVFGAGLKSHPEEWNKLIEDLKDSGVEVIYRNDAMGYGPLKKGQPGQILMDPEASMSALRHEYSHFLEAQKKGFPSAAESYQDWEGRITDEFKAYSIEIEEAKRLGLDNVVKQIQKNFEEEKQYIIDRFKPRD
ncbi:hypothetical protein [Paenibacillus planticolens]|uniref:Large polyvalent protein associated domain-containing protein n=1 Tax=Paenibacillus planticolens TaxID=2654976 RepID=A0ABX1ZNN7_9BACL|nr:hypothetical protein [Paenibacillus planticolens]NOV01566.1 hypothetical protein [Paenibacillus planticolens]